MVSITVLLTWRIILTRFVLIMSLYHSLSVPHPVNTDESTHILTHTSPAVLFIRDLSWSVDPAKSSPTTRSSTRVYNRLRGSDFIQQHHLHPKPSVFKDDAL